MRSAAGGMNRMSDTDSKFHELMKECNELLGTTNSSGGNLENLSSASVSTYYQLRGGGRGGSAGISSRASTVRSAPESSTPNTPGLSPTASSTTQKSSLSKPRSMTESESVQRTGGPESFSPTPTATASPSVSIPRRLASADGYETVPELNFAEDPNFGARPTSASSFRDLVASARLEGEVEERKEAWEQSREVESAVRGTLSAEHEARENARRKREAEREERRRRREEQRHSSLATNTAEAVAATSSTGDGDDVITTSPLAEDTSENTKTPVEAPTVDESSIALKLEEERREAEQRAEEEAIKEEARRRREERLQLEREAASNAAAADALRLQIWEYMRETSWNETVGRSDLSAEEETERSTLLRQYRAMRWDLIRLNTEEREGRERISNSPELLFFFPDIAVDGCAEMEAILRKEMTAQSLCFVKGLLLTVQHEHKRLVVGRLEGEDRQFVWEEEDRDFLQILKSHSAAALKTLDRELWLVNVAEAESRLELEREERSAFEICLDGCSSSRQRVRQHMEAVEVARKQWQDHFNTGVAQVLEAELARRLLLQQEESKEWDVTIGGPSRTSYREAKEVDEQRHRQLVEQAIRETQLFQAQSSSEVQYHQKVSQIAEQPPARMYSIRTSKAKAPPQPKTDQKPATKALETAGKSRKPLKAVKR